MVVVMGAWAQTVPTQQSNGTWQFTMPDANKLLEVNYGLVLTVGPNVVASSESGLIDNHNGTYTVDNGTTVILTATPAEHYHLASWSNGATVNTHDTIHVTVTKDTTVTATFAPNTYSLTLGIDPTEGGSVFFTGYPLQTVTWVCKDIAPTLNLSSQYPSQGNSNHATIDGVTVTCNRGIVEPSNNGYYLRIYSYYNSNHPSLNDIVFTCPDGKTFTKMVINFIGASGSYYTEMPGATLNGYVSSGTGSITWIGNATSIGYGSNLYVSSIEFTLSDGLPDGVQATSMENVYSVEYGTEVELTAAPNDHYHFVKWTDQHSTAMGTSEQLQFTFTKDSTITGNFAIDTFELSFGPLSSSQEAIDAHGWVTIDAVPAGVVQKVENSSPVPGTYKVPYGTKVTLKATPDADYHLLSWTYSNSSMTHVEDFEEDTTTITVTGAQTVTGNFAIDSSRIDSVRLTWQVQIGNADPISPKPYVTENPTAADTMGYVMIPIGAEFLIIPSDAQKELVSKLELIDKSAPEGAINGLFSVSATKKVYFSKGNLQYVGTWQFATNQYDTIGNSQADNNRDLFGWGTKTNPNNTNTNSSDYSSWAEWGENAITNGGNTENSGWRTLTAAEWWYLFFTRSGVRYAKAQVDGKPGVILLPDDWSTSYYPLASTNIDYAAFTTNVIDASTWSSSLEAHGAVFLPAAGSRNGTSVSNIKQYGYYWSSTPNGSENAIYVTFGDTSSLYAESSSSRHFGYSVRLVKDAN